MEPGKPFHQTARMYDLIYEDIMDYPDLAGRLRAMLAARGHASGSLLEVACGTGLYLQQLTGQYDVVGMDISPDMLEIARTRLPEVELVAGDMRTFDLGRRFDVVICMFSSIGYMETHDDLAAAYENMARHLAAGGVLVVEPWFVPEVWEEGRAHGNVHTGDDGLVLRLSTSVVEGSVSVMDMHHLATLRSEEVAYIVERHRMLLATPDEHLAAFERAGLVAEHDAEGLTGRGLYFAGHSVPEAQL